MRVINGPTPLDHPADPAHAAGMARPRTPPHAITPQILLRAYSIGVFPMSEGADDPTLFWVDPPERGIFPLDGMIISHKLARTIRADRFAIHVDRDFEAIIDGCAASAPDRPSTWISHRIRDLYTGLFDMGAAHCLGAYDAQDQLVGGLYGVSIGGAFFGESMFHRATDASKVTLMHLAARLVAGGFSLLDTQFVTPHLETLGAIEIPRADYLARLEIAMLTPANFLIWPKDEIVSGATVLDLLTT